MAKTAAKRWDDVVRFRSMFYEIRGAGNAKSATIRSVLASIEGAAALENVVGEIILAGYQAAADTTMGWVRETELPNFKLAPLVTVQGGSRPRRLGRGGATAQPILLRLQAEHWQLARYALQFAIGEEDLVDTQQVDLLSAALAQVGAAMAGLRPDLVYSTMLRNGDLADDTPLFDTDRGNLASGGSSALDATSLDAGLAAIAGQTLLDEQNDPVHLGLAGKYLIVPPAGVGNARRLARAMAPR